MYHKTKYYPVDINQRIIYNKPFARERDCAEIHRGIIGIKGERLNRFKCYKEFKLVEVLERS